MLGSLFRKKISATQLPNEKCRWCYARRIGLVDHAPVPVCEACWADAWTKERARLAEYSRARDAKEEPADFVEGSLHRMMREFDREFRVHMKRGNAPITVIDMLTDTQTAVTDLAALGTKVDEAEARGDHETVAKLSAEMRAKEDMIDSYRKTGPAMVSELDRAGEQ